tara:strand:- start:206 stop:400 length:195 start_codon:yes stop_codon:yes gene_type:complete
MINMTDAIIEATDIWFEFGGTDFESWSDAHPDLHQLSLDVMTENETGIKSFMEIYSTMKARRIT